MIAESNPSPAEHSGRTKSGLFAAGNKIGKGNPHAKRVNALRTTLLKTFKPSDMQEVVEKLIEQAKAGDVPSIKELFDRTLGKPAQSVEISAAASEGDAEPIMSRDELLAALSQRGGVLIKAAEPKAN